MVERVSTAGNYAAVLANLTAAQQAQMFFGNEVATQKNGTDLKSYATSADTLTAMHTVQARLQSYTDQNTVIADRLSQQDATLNQTTDATGAIRDAIANALATGHADTLMQDIQSNMMVAVQGLNAQYDGKYLYAGGQVNTQPVSVTQLSDLTPPANVASFFHNDNYKLQNKLDDSTTVTSGMLASDIGTPMMNALQTIQSYVAANGPFSGTLTQAQIGFLTSQVSTWDQVRTDLTTVTATNGMVQKQVSDSKTTVSAQHDTVTGMLGDITDADMGLAASQLQEAQMAVQAAAHVYQTLNNSSLLSILPVA
jgi:flagellar hook-associated protein 3 FlgL